MATSVTTRFTASNSPGASVIVMRTVPEVDETGEWVEQPAAASSPMARATRSSLRMMASLSRG